jgi:hypothetical protein
MPSSGAGPIVELTEPTVTIRQLPTALAFRRGGIAPHRRSSRRSAAILCRCGRAAHREANVDRRIGMGWRLLTAMGGGRRVVWNVAGVAVTAGGALRGSVGKGLPTPSSLAGRRIGAPSGAPSARGCRLRCLCSGGGLSGAVEGLSLSAGGALRGPVGKGLPTYGVVRGWWVVRSGGGSVALGWGRPPGPGRQGVADLRRWQVDLHGLCHLPGLCSCLIQRFAARECDSNATLAIDLRFAE